MNSINAVLSVRTLAASGVVLLMASAAQGAFVSLTAVTTTTPNFAGTNVITGTVIMTPGEIMYNPNVMSSHAVPFLSTYAAGFNGPGSNQGWDPAFLAWNGLGTYTGPILNHEVHPNNTGYSGGSMPMGMYASNFLGPFGGAGITLHWYTLDGQGGAITANYAIEVVPAPGAAGLLVLGGVLSGRRRRRAG